MKQYAFVPSLKEYMADEDIKSLLVHVRSSERRSAGVTYLASLAKSGMPLSHPKKYAGKHISMVALKAACEALGEDVPS